MENKINTYEKLANSIIEKAFLEDKENSSTAGICVFIDGEKVTELRNEILKNIENSSYGDVTIVKYDSLIFNNGAIVEFAMPATSMTGRFKRHCDFRSKNFNFIFTSKDTVDEFLEHELVERLRLPQIGDVANAIIEFDLDSIVRESDSIVEEDAKKDIKKFKVVKNQHAECYLAEEDGVITTNELHDGSTITYKKGDWICNDPNNKNDIWPIEKSIHGNYTVSELD